MPLPWLDPIDAPIFPCTSRALSEPNGLLAAGGSLDADWLALAQDANVQKFDGSGPVTSVADLVKKGGDI